MTDYPWLALADRLRKQLDDWQRQAYELDCARAGLDPEDRDTNRELEENKRINDGHEKVISEMILEGLAKITATRYRKL